MSSADDKQVGGSHYKNKPIEVWDFVHQNGLGYLAGNAVKYLSRYKEKNGVEDLRKAIHYIEKLIEVEEQAEVWNEDDCGPGRGYVNQD